jgi:hypothetical protein
VTVDITEGKLFSEGNLDDDSIMVTADPLWSFGKSAGNEFTEAVFGICKSPFHGGSYLARLSSHVIALCATSLNCD